MLLLCRLLLRLSALLLYYRRSKKGRVSARPFYVKIIWGMIRFVEL
jgi:hypothetical protein